MVESAPRGLTIGTLWVRSSSDTSAHEIATEFRSGLANELAAGSPLGVQSPSLKLNVVRQIGESVADAATRAMVTQFAETGRGR